MSLVVGVGLVALLQVQVCVAEGSQLGPATAPPPQAAPAEPEILRPKSVTEGGSTKAPVPASAPESEVPEPSDVPPPEVTASESAWPPSEPVETALAPGEPEFESKPESKPVPVASDTAGVSAPESALRLPDEAGRGLMIGSIATGSLGWAMSLGTIGLLSKDCNGLGECFGQLETFIYLTGIRWAANGTAMSLAIPAAAHRARYDATKEAIEGTPARNMDAFIKGGAAALGVGAASWVILRVGLFTFFQRCGGSGCGTGYLVGLQTSFAMASAGSGVLSYGVAYRKHRKGLGSKAEVRVVPQLSAQYSGLSLAGRF